MRNPFYVAASNRAEITSSYLHRCNLSATTVALKSATKITRVNCAKPHNKACVGRYMQQKPCSMYRLHRNYGSHVQTRFMIRKVSFPECKDHLRLCHRFRDFCAKGKSDNNNSFMELHCPKTCGKCSPRRGVPIRGKKIKMTDWNRL